MQPLTDEERQVLIAELRHAERPLCDMAAEEIERLKGENDWLRSALCAAADRLKEKEREVVMALGGRQHSSVR